MKKQLGTIDFVSMGLSKDDSKTSLQYLYRDTDKYYATDGFRLFVSTTVDKIEKPHVVGAPYDYQYPDVQHILNDQLNKPKLSTLSLIINDQAYKQLKAFSTVAKLDNRSACAFEVTKGKEDALTIEFKQNSLSLSLGLHCALVSESVTFYLNFQYLFQVIEFEYKASHNKTAKITIDVYQDSIFTESFYGRCLIMQMNERHMTQYKKAA